MNKVRIMWCVTITLIAFAGAVTFSSCKKDKVLNNTKQEQIENPIKKWLEWHGCIVNGQVYLPSEESFNLLMEYGGYFWFFDNEGNVHLSWPNGDPFYYPGSNRNGSSNPPLPPPPSSTPSIGEFVLYTLRDMMEAPISQRRDLVMENMNVPYHPCISLSAKIPAELLEMVASGECIIPSITETITENEDQVMFRYGIHFFNSANGITSVVNVLFNFERSEE
jgi:hypothetical protein